MQLTLESDYAIRFVIFLIRFGKRADAKTISENTGVTLRFALKILRKLAGGGVIRSYKGVTGGYELAKKPEEITLAEVIGLIEGPYCLSRCLKADGSCSHGEGCECKVSGVLADISREVDKRLQAVTFDQLV
ncbi:MAG: Rrf2 family transcriptional regulator [Oscillospiraceae bacterium]|nr:Rrf2 family transcriptional regulator [Oscillospiraceae bacterium]